MEKREKSRVKKPGMRVSGFICPEEHKDYTFPAGKKSFTEKIGENEIEYFSTHGIMTHPGKYVYLYKDIPDDIEGICNIRDCLDL